MTENVTLYQEKNPDTVKIVDKDCPGGYRIINRADLTDDDKPFVEKKGKGEKGDAE